MNEPKNEWFHPQCLRHVSYIQTVGSPNASHLLSEALSTHQALVISPCWPTLCHYLLHSFSIDGPPGFPASLLLLVYESVCQSTLEVLWLQEVSLFFCIREHSTSCAKSLGQKWFKKVSVNRTVRISLGVVARETWTVAFVKNEYKYVCYRVLWETWGLGGGMGDLNRGWPLPGAQGSFWAGRGQPSRQHSVLCGESSWFTQPGH